MPGMPFLLLEQSEVNQSDTVLGLDGHFVWLLSVLRGRMNWIQGLICNVSIYNDPTIPKTSIDIEDTSR